jgi:hypothetical protein
MANRIKINKLDYIIGGRIKKDSNFFRVLSII